MHYVYQEPIWSLLWLLNHVQHTKFKSSNTSRTVLKLSFTVKSSRPSEWILYIDMLDQEILNPPSSSDQTPLDQTVLYSDSLVLYLIFNMASLFKSLPHLVSALRAPTAEQNEKFWLSAEQNPKEPAQHYQKQQTKVVGLGCSIE